MSALGWLWKMWRFFVAGYPSATVPAPAPAPGWDDGYGYLGAVGESHYQPAIRAAAAGYGRLCRATLMREPENPFDRDAVVVQINGETVGYLSRGDAQRYRTRLRALDRPIEIPAKLIGGEPGKPSFGVLLDCRDVEHLPRPKPFRKKKAALPEADQPF